MSLTSSPVEATAAIASRYAPSRGASKDAAALPKSRVAAGITLAHFALFAVALGVLSTAIGWPDILRAPPSEVFERISGAASATRLGYFSYLLSSLLMVPLAFVLRDVFMRGGLAGWWLDALTFLGAAAGVLKTLGIVRWLLTMPALARQHAGADTEAQRQTIEAVFQGVNGYGGSVGELLGVALYSGVWFVGISLALIYFRQWLVGGLGLVVAAMTLALATRPFFPDVGVVESIGGPLWLVWLVCLSVCLWRGKA